MGKTIQVAADRQHDESVTILPREISTGFWVKSPPGAQATKLLHMLIAEAAGRMAEDTDHEIRLSKINNTRGMKHHTQRSVADMFEELADATMSFENGEDRIMIANIIDYAEIQPWGPKTADLTARWRFTMWFIRMAAKSYHWAVVDRQTALSMKSKYALVLFQHVCQLQSLENINHKTFTVRQLRRILGLERTRTLQRFCDLNARAIRPAIEEINRSSRLVLKTELHKEGRSIESITISWAKKTEGQQREIKRELDRHSAGRRHRQAGTAERIAEHPPFPSSIHSFRGGFWETVYRDAGCKADMEATRTGFIEWTERTGKPKTPKLFFNFCKGENERKGV